MDALTVQVESQATNKSPQPAMVRKRVCATSHPRETAASTASVRRRHAQRELLPPVLTIAAGHANTAETIVGVWLAGKAEHTIRGYRHDLEDFAVYLSGALRISPALSANEALTHLLRQSSPSAHEVALGFRFHLLSAGLSAASINRHLATLRSVTKLGRLLGMTAWYLEVPGLKAEARRDARGPTVYDVHRMLAASSDDTEAHTRDVAIVVTLYCLGLRVSELCGLNLEDTDLSRGYTWIKGKGRREREPVPLPALVVDAIRRYVKYRGDQQGPLFLARGHRGGVRQHRLDTRSAFRIVRQLGQRVDLHVGCHALRHSSIIQAAALGQTAGFGLDEIRAHSRHRSMATLMTYVDGQNRSETQRSLADLVAGTLMTCAMVKARAAPTRTITRSGRKMARIRRPPQHTPGPTAV